MRAALFFAAILFSPRAFAVPQVGDRAVYDVTSTKEGRSTLFISTSELVQYDADNQRFLERETRRAPGQPDVIRDTWRDPGELLIDDKVDQILEDCAECGGAKTTVTVPAGTFAACMLPVDADDTEPGSGWVWIAKVKFGIVRSESVHDGEMTIKSLRSSQ